MRTILLKLIRLDPARRALLAEAAALNAALAVLCRVWPSARIVGWVDRVSQFGGPERSAPHAAGMPERPALHRAEVQAAQIQAVAWAVRSVGARVPGSTCLTMAVTARSMLKRRGVESHVRLGVAGGPQTPAFHAWLECDDRVVVGGETRDRYRSLERCNAMAAKTAKSTAFAGN